MQPNNRNMAQSLYLRICFYSARPREMRQPNSVLDMAQSLHLRFCFYSASLREMQTTKLNAEHGSEFVFTNYKSKTKSKIQQSYVLCWVGTQLSFCAVHTIGNPQPILFVFTLGALFSPPFQLSSDNPQIPAIYTTVHLG